MKNKPGNNKEELVLTAVRLKKGDKMIQINWQIIKQDYINSMLTLKEICDKHGVKMSTLTSKIRKEGWRELKEVTSEEMENRTRRILNLSDRILDKVSEAIDEVANHVVKTKEKTKEVAYDDELKKPLSETVSECEREEIVASLIDTGALKQLVATLKDVKDIHLGFAEGSTANEDGSENGVIMISDVKPVGGEGDAAV